MESRRPSAYSPAGDGNEKANVDPWPTSLSTQIEPPCASTARRQKARPRPRPFGCPSCARRANFSNIARWSLGAMPGPLSRSADHDRLRFAPAEDSDAARRAGVLDGVLQQVDDHPPNHLDIHFDHQQLALGQRELDRVAAGLGHRVDLLGGFGDERA
jgi:hypothetical protein